MVRLERRLVKKMPASIAPLKQAGHGGSGDMGTPLMHSESCLWLMALDEAIWGDPMAFRPERFMAVGNTETNSGFMPFGAGRRSCPGSTMGLLHLHLLLANLLYAFQWGPEAPATAVDFTEKFRMVVTMKTRLRASITPRSHF